MAAPPSDIPPWATWAAVAAMAMLAALAGAAGWWQSRRQALQTASAGGVGSVGSAGSATFLGHARELGRRLARMVLALALAVMAVFLFFVQARPPYVGIDPYQNLASQVFARMFSDLVPPDVAPATFAPTDAFVAIFDVALALGFVVAMPYLLVQLAGFFAPALKPRERRILLQMLLPILLLFAIGVLFAYSVVLPQAYTALYAFADVLSADKFLQVNAFVSFTLLFLLASGIAFQTPLVMFALARVGLASPAAYLRYWRHSLIAILVISAIVTPDPTPVSQILVAVPLIGLYFAGVVLAVPAARAFQRSNV